MPSSYNKTFSDDTLKRIQKNNYLLTTLVRELGEATLTAYYNPFLVDKTARNTCPTLFTKFKIDSKYLEITYCDEHWEDGCCGNFYGNNKFVITTRVSDEVSPLLCTSNYQKFFDACVTLFSTKDIEKA